MHRSNNIPKVLNVGFVILSPEPNIGRLKYTLRSIDNNYGKHISRISVVAKKTPPNVIKEIKEICPVVRGRDTISSLINVGINKGYKEWNIIVMEGVWIRSNVHTKYANFLKDKKDIFFPITPDYNRDGMPTKLHNTFHESTLNGFCLHQKTFTDVGNFGDEENFEIAKLLWGAMAVDKGCKFKGVLGIKIC